MRPCVITCSVFRHFVPVFLESSSWWWIVGTSCPVIIGESAIILFTQLNIQRFIKSGSDEQVKLVRNHDFLKMTKERVFIVGRTCEEIKHLTSRYIVCIIIASAEIVKRIITLIEKKSTSRVFRERSCISWEIWVLCWQLVKQQWKHNLLGNHSNENVPN